jgi:succinate dehydrogenase / fumarate reductase cytochrome b subunit
MTKRRPTFFDLRSIRLPVTAVASILHRLAGVVLLLGLPLAVGLLEYSLRSPGHFEAVRQGLASPLAKLLVVACCWALLHHLLAGVRHLAMDLHLGESRVAGRRSAWLVLGAGPVLTVLLGIWLW